MSRVIYVMDGHRYKMTEAGVTDLTPQEQQSDHTEQESIWGGVAMVMFAVVIVAFILWNLAPALG